MKRPVSMPPIFIHSLFRSGSTYLFEAFRRSADRYWCYQEPLNELLRHIDSRPEVLLEIHAEMSVLLRHPKLDKPYFWEFHEIRKEIAGLFRKRFCYDDFFPAKDADCTELKAYLGALIQNAQGRPVFQCCRSFGRSRFAKKEVKNSVHIYLWRNPRDQWWSYKVAPYFDTTNLLILNSNNPPKLLADLKTELAFEGFHDADISREFEHFDRYRLAPEQSYILFYTLWCYALLENKPLADLVINIDALSDSAEYRSEIYTHLKILGITGIDLSDCRVAQSCYSREELNFFEKIEGGVHESLISHGYKKVEIDMIQTLRHEHAPAISQIEKATVKQKASVAAAGRARDAALRLEKELAVHTDERRQLEAHLHAKGIELEQLNVMLQSQEIERQQIQAELLLKDGERQRFELNFQAKEAEVQSLAREIEIIKGQEHQWWSMADGLRAALAVKESECLTQQAALQSKDAEYKNLEAAFQSVETERQTLEAAFALKEAERQQFQAELNSKDVECRKLEAVLEVKETERRRLGAELASQESERRQIQEALNTKEVEFQKLETILEASEADKQNLAALLAEQKSKRQKLQVVLNARDVENRKLEAVLEVKDSERLRMDAELISKESICQLLKTTLHTNEREYLQIQSANKFKEEEYRKLTENFSAKELQLQATEEVLRAKDSECRMLEFSLEAKEVERRVIEDALDFKDAEYQKLQTLVSWKDEELIRRANESAQLEMALGDRESKYQKLQTLISAKDEELRRLANESAKLHARAQELEGEVETLKSQRHLWWSMADELTKELHNIYASHSWRITKPLRAGRRFPSAAVSAMRAVPRQLKASINSGVTRQLRGTADRLNERPKLKVTVNEWLNRFPQLRARLHRAVSQVAHAPPQDQEPEIQIKITELPPRIQRVLGDLKRERARFECARDSEIQPSKGAACG